MSNSKLIICGLLVINIGISLYLLYRKKHEQPKPTPKKDSEPTLAPSTQPTIPNMKAVAL
jgi:hypothetical protein